MTSTHRNDLETVSADHGESVAHYCDICGVNQSTRGKIFTNAHDVWQHKRKRHPEACAALAVNAAPVADAAARPARQKAAKTVQIPRRPPQVHFCPSCGCNLQAVQAALEFVNESM